MTDGQHQQPRRWWGEEELLRAVYAWTKKSFGEPVTVFEIRQRLRDDFSGWDEPTVLECFDDVTALLDNGHAVGVRVRLAVLTDDQAMGFLRTSHPGFPEDFYRDALNEGMKSR